MIQLVRETPTKLRFKGAGPGDEKSLRDLVTYQDKKVDYELAKMKRGTWFVNKYGEEAFYEKLAELKAARTKNLLQEDAQGYWTYTGLTETLEEQLRTKATDLVKYPTPGVIPWNKKPEYEMYPYQREALEALLQARHAGVEIGTGLGKSFIILNLCKRLALRTVVMAPSKDIAKRLYEDFVSAFGKRYVGFFGDGKKEFKKLFTIGISASFTRIETGSPAWDALSTAQVFIADESHQCPAATLAKVCFGLMADAPYRFFFSATQMRGDGLDLLLEAITSKIVYTMTVKEGVDQGYLAKPNFTMVLTDSPSSYQTHDANEMTRCHLYYNPKVNALAGKLANTFIEQYGHQVLILVEELEQFAMLLPHFAHKAVFAHGGVTAENKGKIPEAYHKSDPSELVKEFNAGKIPILVGTSCVSTGTDIKANQTTIYIQGGKSEVQVMQGPCGRSTRLHKPIGKTTCNVIDFDVENIEVVHRHAAAREDIYDSVYGPCRELRLGA